MANSGSRVLACMLPEDWYTHQLEAHWDMLLRLDLNPQPLLDYIEAESPGLLGKYFETLITFWLSSSPHFGSVSKNIQLMDEKVTIGEADILVRDHASGELWQIEVACKYYLGDKNVAAYPNWIGPNGTDSLAVKMEKFKRQTTLFDHSRGKEFLKEHNLRTPVVKIFMKGFFFHHYKILATHKRPKDAGIHYSSGWYIRLSEIDVLSGTMHQWVILPKFLWPCLYNFKHSIEPVLDGREMILLCKEQILKHKRAVLLVQVAVIDGVTTEVSRGFVVSDYWPNNRSV